MEKILKIDSEQMLVLFPLSELETIAKDIGELKDLVKGKAVEDMLDQWIESSVARKMLGVSPKTWQNYRDSRAIPFSQFGRKIYVKKSDLEDFLQSHQIKG